MAVVQGKPLRGAFPVRAEPCREPSGRKGSGRGRFPFGIRFAGFRPMQTEKVMKAYELFDNAPRKRYEFRIDG